MKSASPRPAAKKPTNLRIDSELLREAKLLGINLSRTLEEQLAEIVAATHRQRWVEENGPALSDYNSRIERQGVFSEGLRRF